MSLLLLNDTVFDRYPGEDDGYDEYGNESYADDDGDDDAHNTVKEFYSILGRGAWVVFG